MSIDFLAFASIIDSHLSSVSLRTALSMYADINRAYGNAARNDAERDRDEIAARSDVIRDFMSMGQKIAAIKELRYLSGCGLKEAKDSLTRVYGWN